MLPGVAHSACIQSGVEPPHSTIRHDLWAQMGVRREGVGVAEGIRTLDLQSHSLSL